MMNRIIILCLLSIGVLTASAQVTIGSDNVPSKAALLELKDKEPGKPMAVTDDTNVTSSSGGLLLPRVKLENKNTLQPFIGVSDTEWINRTENKIPETHAGLMVYNLNTTADGLSPGIYVWDGTQWTKSGAAAEPKFFYMPSFNLPISTAGPNNAYGIYEEYKTQFTKAGLHVYEPDEIEFKVTYYDSSIIDNIDFPDNAGNMYMTYDVLSTTAPADAFLNIIIVVK